MYYWNGGDVGYIRGNSRSCCSSIFARGMVAIVVAAGIVQTTHCGEGSTIIVRNAGSRSSACIRGSTNTARSVIIAIIAVIITTLLVIAAVRGEDIASSGRRRRG